MPPDQDIHTVLDNHATHKHEAVEKWVRRRKRVHLHFTPTNPRPLVWTKSAEEILEKVGRARTKLPPAT